MSTLESFITGKRAISGAWDKRNWADRAFTVGIGGPVEAASKLVFFSSFKVFYILLDSSLPQAGRRAP